MGEERGREGGVWVFGRRRTKGEIGSDEAVVVVAAAVVNAYFLQAMNGRSSLSFSLNELSIIDTQNGVEKAAAASSPRRQTGKRRRTEDAKRVWHRKQCSAQ